MQLRANAECRGHIYSIDVTLTEKVELHRSGGFWAIYLLARSPLYTYNTYLTLKLSPIAFDTPPYVQKSNSYGQ